MNARHPKDLSIRVLTILALFVLLQCPLQGHSFGVLSSTASCRAAIHNSRASAKAGLSLLIADITSDASDDRKQAAADAIVDASGKPVAAGNVVRVCVDGLKAYQISQAGQGSFHPVTKAFVPVDVETDTLPKGKRGLMIPVGLRGVVTKVYQEDDAVSANIPIQVKFVPGQYLEEELDSPAPFVMHFLSHEVQIV
jgi:hypothetical protein